MSTFTPDGQMQSTWHIRVGSTFKKKYIWKAGEPAVEVDLTGWTAKAHIRAKEKDPEHLLELSTENGGIVLGGATGAIEFWLDFHAITGTGALTGYKKAVFDVELTNPALDFRRNLIGGPVVLYGERTKP